MRSLCPADSIVGIRLPVVVRTGTRAGSRETRLRLPDEVADEIAGADDGGDGREERGRVREETAHRDDGCKKSGRVNEDAKLGILRTHEVGPPAVDRAEKDGDEQDGENPACHVRFSREARGDG